LISILGALGVRKALSALRSSRLASHSLKVSTKLNPSSSRAEAQNPQ
jgi:hypothetical protein